MDGSTKDITKKTVWSTSHLIMAIAASVSITFSGAMFYADMRHVEREQSFLEASHNKDIETVANRMNKREERNAEDRKALWHEVNELKKKNSDSE